MMAHIEKIVDELSQLSKSNIVLFAALACEKMYPSYLQFSQAAKWRNPEILDNALIIMYEHISNEVNLQLNDLSSIKKQLLAVSPATNEFSNPLASYALDTCCAFDEVLTFILNDEIEHIENAITKVLESVDMYIQEKEDLDPSDPDLEQIIASDEFMIREQNRQLLILDEIKRNKKISSEFVSRIRGVNRGMREMVDLSQVYPSWT